METKVLLFDSWVYDLDTLDAMTDEELLAICRADVYGESTKEYYYDEFQRMLENDEIDITDKYGFFVTI